MSHTYIDQAIEKLQKNRFRITLPRRRLIAFLDHISIPVSAYDIVDHLKQLGEKMDVVTVYRILDCLEKNGLVHRLLLSGKFIKCHAKPCCDSEHDHQDCHHLVICTECGKTEEVHCAEDTMIVPKTSGFLIKGHRLEFFGICPSCKDSGH